MGIWKLEPDIDALNALLRGTMAGHIGIELIEIGEDFIQGRMPVEERTTQPHGLLHGGASVTFGETLGSLGGGLCVDPKEQTIVGQSVNANHVRPARGGHVLARAEPLHIGGRSQVWSIRIENEAGELVSIVRLTLAVLDLPVRGLGMEG
jgi:uncharacterized protein (TIGR00369 family)